MKTPLVEIEILSIYKRYDQRILLPRRMAMGTPDMQSNLLKIVADVNAAGGKLFLSDLFRSYDMQFQAHLDWKTGKKKAYSPPPGGSMHEAGRAFDLSLNDLKIPLANFWGIAKGHGVVPIIDEPNRQRKEAWHFECRGSHAEIYNYYKAGEGQNVKPYQAMAMSSILAIGEKVDRFGANQKEAYLQSGLIRLGYSLGNIDGNIGQRTKAALEESGIAFGDIEKMISSVEDLLQDKYPNEYGVRIASEETLFDFEEPAYIEA